MHKPRVVTKCDFSRTCRMFYIWVRFLWSSSATHALTIRPRSSTQDRPCGFEGALWFWRSCGRCIRESRYQELHFVSCFSWFWRAASSCPVIHEYSNSSGTITDGSARRSHYEPNEWVCFRLNATDVASGAQAWMQFTWIDVRCWIVCYGYKSDTGSLLKLFHPESNLEVMKPHPINGGYH